MLLSEKIAFLLFVAVVATVYYLEARLLVRFAARRLRRRPGEPRLVSRRAIALHCVAGAGLLCMAWGYFVEPYWLQVSTIELATPKLRQTRLRIVQISDLHCDRKVRTEPRLPGLINPLRPDLIVFTGDAVNTPDALPLFRETLGKLEARIGKFAVRGNFDLPPALGEDLFEGTGFRELRADSLTLHKDGETFHLSGMTCGVDELAGVVRAVPPDGYNIFLYHYPDLVERAADYGVDLYLCGHTHGGQVALPLYGALITFSEHGKRYERGLYRVAGTTLYVNRGIGMEGGLAPRVRFWARPEIAVFDIVPAQ